MKIMEAGWQGAWHLGHRYYDGAVRTRGGHEGFVLIVPLVPLLQLRTAGDHDLAMKGLGWL